MKFLLFVAFLGVVWWLWNKRAARPLPPKPPAPERVVVCQHCHVHVPESDSLAGEEGFYCCEAHRRAGPTPPAR